MLRFSIISAVAFMVFFTAHAQASSAVSDVGSAVVKAGVASAELRLGTQTDNGHTRFRSREHLDYGFTDWYAVRLVVLQDRPPGDSYEHDAFSIENRFQFIEKKDYGFDAGVRLVYTHKDGDKTPHDVDVVLLTQVPFAETFEWRSNVIFERNVGVDAEPGIAIELRNQVTYDFGAFAAGVEMFNDFGKPRDVRGFSDQQHDIGPVIRGDISERFYYQAGYRAGLSDAAADHTFKLFFGAHF